MYSDTKQLLSDAKFFEGYARYDEEKGRYETWAEAVDRVMGMHRTFYAKKLSKRLEALIEEASDAYKAKKVLGAQRALQFGGEQLLRHQFKNYNCSFSYADRPAFFGECFYILLCGAGVGFSVQRHHIAKLPKIVARTKAPKLHVVEDSIEGWATALDVLLSSYFEDGGKHPEFRGHRVYFDLTKIRPKGSKISGGFKAPGPDGLRLALDRIEHLLQGAVLQAKTVQLRPIQVYDIVMHTSDAVLSGGVRRSATICLFSIDDTEMMAAKTGNWFIENPQRARSNNSAVVVRSTVTEEQFSTLMTNVKQFGEPGFVFVESTEHGTNPCVTGDTRLLTKDGYKPISSIVGKEVDVWNGKQWSSVTPFSTGINPLVEVNLSNGVSIKCTPYHKFILKGGERKEAKELLPEDKLEKFEMPTISGGSDESSVDAYSQGFYSGDGTKNLNYSWLYETKYSVQDQLCGSVGEVLPGSSNRKTWRHGTMEDKTFVPMNSTLGYKLRWLSGLLDSDGTITKDKNIQITSNDLSFLDEVRMMLTTMGTQAKITPSRDEKMTRFRPEQKEYLTKQTHRLLLNVSDLKHLIDLGLVCYRIKLDGVDPNRDARRFVEVLSVNDLGVSEETFCATEPLNNSLTFDGIVTGNCVEIGLFPVDEESGKTGWEACNLTEINGGACDTEEKFLEACRAASILGTLQAGYTDFKFIDPVSKKICDREALLGVSITGWMSNPSILFDEEILKKGALKVREVNREVAELIGINPAARATCVKPSGNASVLLKTPSGIHPDHAPRYFRNVQMTKNSEVADLLAKTNPHMIEESIWSSGKTDYVISFPVIANEGALFKSEIYGVNHLEYVKKAQMNWVEYGTDVDLCVEKTIRHNVSNTIEVSDWDEVQKYLFDNRKFFAGVSLLPMSGDKIYNQAPFVKVLDHSEIVNAYGTGALFASGLIVDGLKVFDNLWKACEVAKQLPFTGPGMDTDSTMISDFCRRFHKFSKNYFSGDLTKTEHCLKDVYLLHRWEKIQQNLVPVDFVGQLTEKKYIDVDTMGAAACVGVSESGESTCMV